MSSRCKIICKSLLDLSNPCGVLPLQRVGDTLVNFPPCQEGGQLLILSHLEHCLCTFKHGFCITKIDRQTTDTQMRHRHVDERTCLRILKILLAFFACLIDVAQMPQCERRMVQDGHLWIERRPGMLLVLEVLQHFFYPASNFRKFSP